MNSHGPNRHSRAIIDLDAIRHNYRYLQEAAGGNRLIAVVKADAYGHGAVEVARALADAGADAFAVAAVGEAVALRDAGIGQKIVVLGGCTSADELRSCIAFRLDPVLHHDVHLAGLAGEADLGGIDVWLKVDTGMGRLGFAPERAHPVLQSLHELDTIGSIRLMTHLASADEVDDPYTELQLERVADLGLDDFEWGIANSAGILGWPAAHRVWVRAGIALYGADPLSDRAETQRELVPAMTMKSIVLAVNTLRAGERVGYGGIYVCKRDTTIAVIAVGYADGYPRHKIGTARVGIGDALCDVVGRVSMDMITVDVSDVAGVAVGDEVTLFGAAPHVNELADCSETIAYEILCNVGAHAHREYTG